MRTVISMFGYKVFEKLDNNQYEEALSILNHALKTHGNLTKTRILYWLKQFNNQKYIKFFQSNSDIFKIYPDDLWELTFDEEAWEFGVKGKFPDSARYLLDYFYHDDSHTQIAYEDFLINRKWAIYSPCIELKYSHFQTQTIVCTKYIDHLTELLELAELLYFAKKHGFLSINQPAIKLMLNKAILDGNIGLKKILLQFKIHPGNELSKKIKHLVALQNLSYEQKYLNQRLKNGKISKITKRMIEDSRKLQRDDLEQYVDLTSFDRVNFNKADLMSFLQHQSINSINLCCRTPLDIAIESNFFEAADTLRELGAKTYLEIAEEFRLNPLFNTTGSIDLTQAQAAVKQPLPSARLNADFKEACITPNTDNLTTLLDYLDPLTAIAEFESALKLGYIGNCIQLVKAGLHPSLLRSCFIDILRGQYDDHTGLDILIITMIQSGMAVNFIDFRDEGLFFPLDYVKAHPIFRKLEQEFRKADALTIFEAKGLEEEDLF